MDYKNLTAPCGRDCFNCPFFIAKENEAFRGSLAKKINSKPENVICGGCRNIDGKCRVLENYGFKGNCRIYKCVKDKNLVFCFDCDEFPCRKLQPLGDRADKFPHNLKVYNLCLIQKLGVEEWGKNRSKADFNYYFSGKLDDIFIE